MEGELYDNVRKVDVVVQMLTSIYCTGHILMDMSESSPLLAKRDSVRAPIDCRRPDGGRAAVVIIGGQEPWSIADIWYLNNFLGIVFRIRDCQS